MMGPMTHARGRAAVWAAVGALLLAGCSSAGDSARTAEWSSTDSMGAAVAPEAAVPGQAGSAAQDSAGGADGADAPAGADVDPDQGQVVVTGSATVRVEDPEQALADLSAAVSALDGRVASSTVSGADARPSAWAEVRVPTDSYQKLTDALAGLGDVVELSTSTQDVGQQVADLDARAKALQASIDRLTALVEKADTTKDLLEAEQELTTRQAELDSLTGQRQYLADQVAYSTLTVSLDPKAEALDPDPSVWERSWRAFLSSAEAVLTVVVFLLPWLAAAAVIGVPIWLVARRRSAARAALAAPEERPPTRAGGADADGSGQAEEDRLG